MEEDLLALESDIKLKIEHAFDVKHIYDIFATLITGMKHQQGQIRDLNVIINNSNVKIEEMEKSLENMEYNIQGFDSDEDEDFDENSVDPNQVRRVSSSSGSSRRRANRKVRERAASTHDEINLSTTAEETGDVDKGDDVVLPPESSEGRESVVDAVVVDAPVEIIDTSPETEGSAAQVNVEAEVTNSEPDDDPASSEEEQAAAVVSEGTETEEPDATAVESVEEGTSTESPKVDEPTGPATDGNEEVLSDDKVAEDVAEADTPDQSLREIDRVEDEGRFSAPPKKIRTPEEAKEWYAKKQRVLALMKAKMHKIGRTRRAARGVAKSRLDPKLSVNNRIKNLEDGLANIGELVNTHRQALDAIPSRIKKIIPADLNAQMARLSSMMDNLEAIQTGLRPESTSRDSLTDVSTANGGAVWAVDNVGNLPSDILAAIAAQVAEKLKADLPTAPEPDSLGVSAEVLLSDDMVKQLSTRMLEGGHLDELRGGARGGGSRRMFRSRGSAITAEGENMTDEERREAEEEMAAFKEQTTEVVKDLTKDLISRNEISDMLDIEVTPMFDAPVGGAESGGSGSASPARLKSPAVVPRSPSLSSRGAVSAGVGGGQHTGSEFAVKLKSVMEQQIYNLTMNSVKKAEFEDRMRNYETFMNIELSKVNKHCTEQVTAACNPLKDRMARNERSVNDMNILLNSLDATMRSQASDQRRLDSSGGGGNDAWRPELEKMNMALQESLKDQRNIAQALLSDLERIQREINNRVDEKRLEELVAEIDAKINTGVERGVDPMLNSIANIVRAVKSKADRNEVQRVVAARIHEAEAQLQKIEADVDAAGSFKCISCGNAKSVHPGSPNGLQPADAFHSSISSWGADASGDYDQVMAVLHRKAGLKSLTRHSKPMVPSSRPSTTSTAPAPYNKTPKFPVEPLYRRAKAVAHAKEMPKAPLVTFGPSHADPAGVYQLDKGGTSNQQGGVSGVKFPQVSQSSARMSQSTSALHD